MVRDASSDSALSSPPSSASFDAPQQRPVAHTSNSRQRTVAKPQANFWIEVPPLTEPRDEYIRIDAAHGSSDVEIDEPEEETRQPVSRVQAEESGDIIEVVGEHIWPDGRNWYYARTEEDITRKFKRDWIEKYFGVELQDYETRKEQGRLRRFDPFSTEVRPADRPPKGAPRTRSPPRPHRTARAVKAVKLKAASITSSEDDSDTSFSDPNKPTRRSARQTKAKAPQTGRSTRKRNRSTSWNSATEDAVDISSEDTTTSEDDDDDDAASFIYATPHHPIYEVGEILPSSKAVTESDAEFKHRPTCVKCNERPAHIANQRRGKKKGKVSSDALDAMGGWVTCIHCCTAIHWGCLPAQKTTELLHTIRRRERAEFSDHTRTTLEPSEMTTYVCSYCTVRIPCLGCQEPVGAPTNNIPSPQGLTVNRPSSTDQGASSIKPDTNAEESAPPLLFRCKSCFRAAHYAHLVPLMIDDKQTPAQKASEYQRSGWSCKYCKLWTHKIDKILGWRPYPIDAAEPSLEPDKVPKYKDNLPREYLVKWEGKSFRRLEWVPHAFVSPRFPAKLNNFLNRKGQSVQLLEPGHPQVVEAKVARDTKGVDAPRPLPSVPTRDNLAKHEYERLITPPADPDVELKVPDVWKLVDRLLEVKFYKPLGGRGVRCEVADTEDEAEARRSLFDGHQPPASKMETFKQRKQRLGRRIKMEDVKDIVWCYIKWQDLGFEDATWDSPPTDPEAWETFKTAFGQFILARDVVVPVLTREQITRREERAPLTDAAWRTVLAQPKLGQPESAKLKPFQLEGYTWLYNNWHTHRSCILADEMGLGKTVQIATFLGRLVQDKKVFPALVVVPNSTITNWLRELSLWAPGVRAIMYSGSAASREIIRDWEMYNETGSLAYHVLVTTYETLIGSNFSSIFKSVPRWEVLVVDEAQRLKSDKGLLGQRLRELNVAHRVLMTGTPLNNNLRELFNLMSFVDPETFRNVDVLEREYDVATLTQEKITELHSRLKPYFLRRVKADVMQDLPPKRTVLVPITMTPLQKEQYKNIFSQNATALARLVHPSVTAKKGARANFMNILMELRKCMQHPFCVDPDLEREVQTAEEMQKQLVEASAKLRLLQLMLPRLKAKGHRVLLFSQFKMALDIIEDFVAGEGYKYMRLDGDLAQAQRQKDMDAFNRPDSEYFIYLLTTRAGGVGINLWSADTVIIHDPDFNPHQDLQAIARAHRMGQKKPVLVFTLMLKDSAEEKIVEAGKRKLALDHVIVQQMDEDEPTDNIQSILGFGAKALFTEQQTRDIRYSPEEVDALIEKVETKEDDVEPSAAESGNSFGFAQVWERSETATAVEDDGQNVQDDFWAELLARTKAAEDAQVAEVGRGVRRKATKQPIYRDLDAPLSPTKRKAISQGDDEDFSLSGRSPSAVESVVSHQLGLPLDIGLVPVAGPSSNKLVDPKTAMPRPKPRKKKKPAEPVEPAASTSLSHSSPVDLNAPCRICNGTHPSGACPHPRVLSEMTRYKQAIQASSEIPAVKSKVMQALDEQMQAMKEAIHRKKPEASTSKSSHKRQHSGDEELVLSLAKPKIKRPRKNPSTVPEGSEGIPGLLKPPIKRPRKKSSTTLESSSTIFTSLQPVNLPNLDDMTSKAPKPTPLRNPRESLPDERYLRMQIDDRAAPQAGPSTQMTSYLKLVPQLSGLPSEPVLCALCERGFHAARDCPIIRTPDRLIDEIKSVRASKARTDDDAELEALDAKEHRLTRWMRKRHQNEYNRHHTWLTSSSSTYTPKDKGKGKVERMASASSSNPKEKARNSRVDDLEGNNALGRSSSKTSGLADGSGLAKKKKLTAPPPGVEVIELSD